MNLARLRVFDEVARTGTFAAAAEALSYTPSAVSQQMAKLEAELGTALLIRGRTGVTLTVAGETLLTRTRAILGEVRQAQSELDALAGVRAGAVRLGSFPTATQTVIADVLPAFAATYPGVSIKLVDDEPHHNLARLRDHDLDLAVVFGVEGRSIGLDYWGVELVPEAAVTLTPLFEDAYVAVVPEGHALADGTVTVDALRDEVVIGSVGTPGLDELADRCRLNGFVCTDYQSVRALVAAGQGIAVLPGLAAAHPFAGTVARPFEGPRRTVYLARAADGVTSPAAAAMADVIIAHAAG